MSLPSLSDLRQIWEDWSLLLASAFVSVVLWRLPSVLFEADSPIGKVHSKTGPICGYIFIVTLTLMVARVLVTLAAKAKQMRIRAHQHREAAIERTQQVKRLLKLLPKLDPTVHEFIDQHVDEHQKSFALRASDSIGSELYRLGYTRIVDYPGMECDCQFEFCDDVWAELEALKNEKVVESEEDVRKLPHDAS